MKKQKLIPNQKVYTKRKKPFPECVIIWEPVCEWVEKDEGKWIIKPVSWCYAVIVNSDCDNAEFNECYTPEEIVDVAEYHLSMFGQVVFVSHGVEQCIVMMEFSEHFWLAGFQAEAYFLGRERAFIQVARGAQKITYCDLRNWIPGDPSKIGAWADFRIDSPPRWYPDEDGLPRHAANNLFALVAGWNKYIEWNHQSKVGGFAFSMSSLAYNYWTRTEGAKKARHPRNKKVAQMEKDAFYGGFCYAHRTGCYNDDFYYLLDCNGMYGHILRDSLLPYRHVTTRKVVKDTDLDKALQRGGVIVHGRFSLKSGFLPVRTIRSLFWGQEEIECWLPQPELMWVLENGIVHKLNTIIVYDMDYVGKPIAEYALQQRFLAKEQGKNFEAKLWKLFITNFFGKCAQRFGSIMTMPAREDEEDKFEQCISATTGLIYSICVFCGTKIISIDDGESACFVPSISAFVSSYGRAKLWKLGTMAGWENVFYNDTDSLIVNSQGYNNLKHLIANDVPGMLSLEEEGSRLEILGKKQYRIGNKTADNSHPAIFKPHKDGLIEYCEMEYEGRRQMGMAGQISVRKAFSQSWEARLQELQAINEDVPF